MTLVGDGMAAGGPVPGAAGESWLPPKETLRICFAHPAYQMAARFAARDEGIAHVEVRTFEDLAAELPHADVLVVSQMWKNDLAARAPKLRFIQSISAGVDQYDQALLRARGIRLASAAGVTAHAVAAHAMALILALKRHLHTGRDNQARKHWRAMISHVPSREDQLGGKTLLIVGLGRVGSRLAKLAKAFDMRVVATRRDASRGGDDVDAVYRDDALLELLPSADVVALTCPLTPSTENLVDGRALAAMKPSAHLINVARGRIVDEEALIQALRRPAHRGRRPRRHPGGAAAGGVAALEPSERADHAAQGRRDPADRGWRARPAHGEPGTAVAWRAPRTATPQRRRRASSRKCGPCSARAWAPTCGRRPTSSSAKRSATRTAPPV